MKVIVKAILAVLLILPIGAFAQAKFGHVNTQKLLEAMPEVKAANAKLDTLNKSYQAQMKELIDEYQKKAAAFQDPSNASKWSETIVASKRKEIEQLGERIQAFKEDASNDVQKQTEALMTPIRKKLGDAIKDVANTGKYTLILDSSQTGIVLFAADGDDVTDLVKKKLGLK